MTKTHATVLAVDFVSQDYKARLDEILLEVSGREEPPDKSGRGGMNVLSLTIEDWGQVEFSSEIFSSVSIEVVSINSFPLTNFVILSAEVAPSFLRSIWSKECDEDFKQCHRTIQNVWKETFGDDFPGLISNLDDNQVYIPDHEFPLTIGTINTGFELHTAITGQSEFRTTQEVLNAYSAETDVGGVFTDLGINPSGYRSLVNIYKNAVTVVGQTGVPQLNSRIVSMGYTFIEISDSIAGEVSIPPKSSLLMSEKYLLRLLQLLYLYYWFRTKRAEFPDHNETIRELSLSEIKVGASVNELQNDMRALLQSEASFIDSYSKVDNQASVGSNYLEYLTEWFSQDSNGEVGLENPSRISRQTNEPLSQGVFMYIREDTQSLIEETATRYEELFSRYKSVSGQLSKLLSFQTSATNIQTNRRILWLTVILLALPVFSGLGGFEWIRSNIYPWLWEVIPSIFLRAFDFWVGA